MSQLDRSAKWMSRLAAYGAAILSVVVALVICWLAPRVFSINTQPLFLAAVILSTWFGGLWPGLLTVALSSLTIEWFNLPPNFAFGLTVEDMPRYTEFILVALLIATLTGRQKRTNEMLQAEMAERQRADDALQKAQADLARVTRATTLGEMVASIAHEVNQPLAAVVINGNACLRWLAGETPNLDEARAAVEHIVGDGHRAGKVIAQIRALVENTPPKRVRLNINELVLDTIALAHREIAKNQAVVRTELAADLPAVVGDRVQLQQVFLNLIMNGLEAMSAVTDRPREMRINSRQSNDMDGVLIEVRDCGGGIEPESMDQLFDPFFSTKPEGIGMGLSICRSIITAHGGRLWAAPNPDHGATFMFAIPANRESP